MNNKEIALSQIDDINKIINANFKAMISGTEMIVVGLLVAAIPLIELVLSNTVDPVIIKATTMATPLLFVFRTIFYWTLFYVVGHFWHTKAKLPEMHPLIKKAWALGKIFPIVPIATAAMLAITGYSNLIAPIIMILIGCMFAVFGQFTSKIVSIIAWIYIIVGIGSIYLTTFSIPNLWMYLVVFQGLACVSMGLVLRSEQNTK